MIIFKRWVWSCFPCLLIVVSWLQIQSGVVNIWFCLIFAFVFSLTETLRSYFSQYGEVVDCVIMKDKTTNQSRGFGFVKFKDPNCVGTVLASRPHTLDGRNVSWFCVVVFFLHQIQRFSLNSGSLFAALTWLLVKMIYCKAALTLWPVLLWALRSCMWAGLGSAATNVTYRTKFCLLRSDQSGTSSRLIQSHAHLGGCSQSAHGQRKDG